MFYLTRSSDLILKLELITFIFFIIGFVVNSPKVISLEVAAVGDIFASEDVLKVVKKEYILPPILGDIVFANFEGVLGNPKTTKTAGRSLVMSKDVIPFLKGIGVGTLSLANNHSMDLGRTSYDRTYSTFAGQGFNVAGLYDSGTVIKVADEPVRFIAFSFSGDNNVLDVEKAVKKISAFKEDMIIVSAHMGGEEKDGYLIPAGMEYYGDEKRGDVVQFARKCIDAGASLVLGHGPHVFRRLDLYKGKLIVYSLGNYLFDFPRKNEWNFVPAYSIKVQLNKKGTFISGKIQSFNLVGGIPKYDMKNRVLHFIKKLSSEKLFTFEESGVFYAKSNPH